MESFSILLAFSLATVAGATDNYGGGPAEFQEYHYNLPVKETHSHISQVVPKEKGRAHPQSITSALDQHDLYGGSVAAAVGAAQQAHAQRYSGAGVQQAHAQRYSAGAGVGDLYGESHYTKPGSVGIHGITAKAPLSYSPLSSPYVRGHKVGVRPKATAILKKPASVDAEGAHGYLHGNYASVGGFGHGGYALSPGYGYSMGYPGVGYGNVGAGFGQYGYSGFPYGGAYGGLAHAHGYHGGALGGYGQGFGGIAGGGYGLGGGYSPGPYDLGAYGGAAAYPAYAGYALGGYGVGGGIGLGHGHGGGLGNHAGLGGGGGYYGGVAYGG